MDRRTFIHSTAAAGAALASVLAAGAQAQERLTCVMFTKFLKSQSIEELIESQQRIGSDGMDLTVRPGYPVNPDNCTETLAPAVEKIRAAGLVVPMVTSPTDLTTVDRPYARDLFRACGEAGVPLLKLGYWPAPKSDYWGAVRSLNDDLRAFVELGEEFGVKPCLHTHSGNHLFLNAAAMMHTLREFEPEEAGAYIDVGHISVCGEPAPLAFNMAAEWLSIVGMKDCERLKRDDGTTSVRTVPMGEGFVDWRSVVGWLVEHSFAGPLAFHCEFAHEDIEDLLTQATREFAFVRALEAEARG